MEVRADESLYAALRRADHPIASTCDGDLVCGRCVVRIEAGRVEPPRPGRAEEELLASCADEPDAERFACAVRIAGDGVVVSASYW